MSAVDTRQSSWTKYSWKCARFRICVLLQVDRELLDLPEKKAGERRPGVGGAGQIGEQVAEGERAGRRRRLDDVEPLPTQIGAHLDRVAALQPRQRVGNLRHARAEVGRGVRRRPELLITGDQKRRQRVRKRAVAGIPGRLSAADAERRQLRGRRRDRAPRVADAQLVQQAVGKRALVARRERPRRGVLRASVPVVTPLPSGSGVTGMNVSAKSRQPAEDLIAIRRELMIDAGR